MRSGIVFITLFNQIILASFVFAQTSQITNGLNYLSAAQNEDGFWSIWFLSNIEMQRK